MKRMRKNRLKNGVPLFARLSGEKCVSHLRYEDLMLVLSHLGDPRNAFLLYFPISYCLHRPAGTAVLWLACLSEWINAVLKWMIFGDRPYWWIKESGLFEHNTTYLKQYSLTCETGPGSPSGHAMVTSSVMYCMVSSVLNVSYLNTWKYMKYTVWGLYVMFMLAVTMSRCFIATHFPHQVILGTFIGILLSIEFMKIQIDNIGIRHYVICSAIIPSSCLVLYFSMKGFDLDPGWSVALATKWCQKSEWVHLDTTPFNSVIRDAGSILGFGFVCLIKKTASQPRESPSHLMKALQIILAIIYSQVIENLKPVKMDASMYYCLTFVKFFVQAVGVHFISLIYLSDVIFI